MKAQFWSIDMVFAIVIFSGGIILLSFIWSSMNGQFSSSYGYSIGIMQIQLNNLLQRIQTTGSPPNWNSMISVNSLSPCTNVSVGLESSQGGGALSRNKLLALMAMANNNYQATKQCLGVGYDYYIALSSQGQYNISIGRNPFLQNATAIQVATVPVVLDNGQSGQMRVIVWTNTTFGVG
jgi:nitrogen fixation-related uncharacterized protein